MLRAGIVAIIVLIPLVVQAGKLDPAEQRELGRRLFEQSWLKPPADDSPLALARRGDGLGPLFNAASCAECHHLGGVGGAGPNEHNVEIVTLILPADVSDAERRRLTRKAMETHPALLHTRNLFLHRFGVERDGTLRAYDEFREGIRSHFPEGILPAHQTETVLPDGLTYQLAQRNTPALWGAGQIDAISAADIRELESRQRLEHPQFAGIAADEGAGKFGWRGQTSSLDHFVRDACASELGLRVSGRGGPVHEQAPWPLEGASRRSRSRASMDLSPAQVEALVAFVRALPPPREVIPADPAAAAQARRGREMFDSIGCAVCHVPDLGGVKGLYSDMLLHDMGPDLADLVAAPETSPQFPLPFTPLTQFTPESAAQTGRAFAEAYLRSASVAFRSFTFPGFDGPLVGSRMFRTPALWGVADSAPYLHDGRAETLDEAIRLHGGQAASVADRYATLPQRDREALLSFLGTLRAPDEK